jgi:dCTP deaminase
MTFWSGDTLRNRLGALISPPNVEAIDCAAYTLTVGPEYYVTPTDQSSDPKRTSLKTLDEGEAFAVPPGGFAYVLTEEIVTVPADALAFISIRARIKWRGLINVSGFHVDPGFCGRLTFAVFNAGPVSVHLRRGDPTFLIWFADLDHASTTYLKSSTPIVERIDLGALNQVAGEVHSIQGLEQRIRTTEKDLGQRITALERANGLVIAAAGALMTLVLAFVVQLVMKMAADPTPQKISTPAEASADAQTVTLVVH